ncbi:5-formyltetrahydrofolate cyclo-ligase [Bifidobacterium cebidarum]|uniref:5-formyltetrahydrofolate cyclo-ligase n=1 Tax=Bifidobacterium cebidarum TaxID=2650773 RepID=A0A6I1GIY2_9BIFI|nr:5-formyltetrahydrofolate cyclo-ligase [Bifidobacterium cebidarum]KAB7789369.1 5-formyltetrahydrofolate cyclo-ligase [Bifidobacterium cebidarum]
MSGVGITDKANGQAADKTELRHQALAKRKFTTAEERLDAGRTLVRVLKDSPEFVTAIGALKSGVTVAAYVSMGSEIETRPLLGWLLERGCEVLVPKLGSGLDLGWSMLHSLDDLHVVDGHGHLRPDEPEGDTLPPQALIQASAVFAPALGVDPRGYRLGRGAGWYDRALANRNPDCPLIAICWPWEVMERSLPAEPHDVPADAVLTPKGFRLLDRNANHDIPRSKVSGQ